MMNRIALVTGATSGIGRATAEVFAKNGYDVIITGRRKERLDDFAKEVYKGFQPLTGKDIADVIYYVTTLPGHVNINDLLIMPAAQANATTLLKK